MSNLVEHARRELKLLGEDPVYSASLVAAVAAFASFGHSGASAEMAREQLHTLLGFGNLTPLTDDPEDWHDHSEMSGAPLWQNRRNSACFSGDGGKTYWNVTDQKEDNAELPRHKSAPKPEGARP
ncbi:hypothetical protein L3Q65_45950 [Amycolatopsis sp. FU40]|uniref:hypothetical protein n=1 Tax=Amycolatopsis sp. FU40 TaxID=2914159 RepID=UPI001F1F4060|nr:hypothetical protein [Amycolatopsis sp. FU40]UKD55118.1 hypothetical protein L3Q65_45950 [Amycolatopsis sp. FU40]